MGSIGCKSLYSRVRNLVKLKKGKGYKTGLMERSLMVSSTIFAARSVNWWLQCQRMDIFNTRSRGTCNKPNCHYFAHMCPLMSRNAGTGQNGRLGEILPNPPHITLLLNFH